VVLPRSFYLLDNPFGIAPRLDRLTWADQKEFKDDLSDALAFSFSTTPSRIIACIFGRWGAGKTHALRYFSQQGFIQGVWSHEPDDRRGPPFVVPVIYPMTDVLKTLYTTTMESIGMARIDQAVANAAEDVDELSHMGALEEKIDSFVGVRNLGRVLAKIHDDTLPIERYLTSKVSIAELRKLGVPRAVESNADRVEVLCGIIRLLTSTLVTHLVLWIDDVERISDAPGKEANEFHYFVRDLLDKVPQRLIIIMNFTYYPGEDVADRLQFLGDALLDRISRQILIKDFDKERYSEYIRDLLLEYRAPGFDTARLSESHPFDQGALDYVYEELSKKSRLQPRRVNNVLSTLLDIAAGELGRSSRSRTITKEYVEKNHKRLFQAAFTAP